MRLLVKRHANKHWRNNLILLVCIIVLFIIGTSFDVFDRAPLISCFFFTLLVLSSVAVIDYVPLIRKVLYVLGAVVLAFIWLDYFIPEKILSVIGFMLLALFLFSVTISLITHVATSKEVSVNIIFSAINGYLLLGIIGGIGLLIVDVYTPNRILSNVDSNAMGSYMYFSFVTLTTLGYGDLTPVVAGSRVVSMLLSISGQLYIAILIAMLVGKYLSQPANNKQ